MGRWARWVVLAVGVVGASWFAWHLHGEAAQQSARDAVYEAKLDQLRKAYPVGTPRGRL